jgi:hypothetical protein
VRPLEGREQRRSAGSCRRSIAKVLVPVPRIECSSITSGERPGSARRVLEAEVQVVEERAVGVLDVEVALFDQEAQQLGSTTGSGCWPRGPRTRAWTDAAAVGEPADLLADAACASRTGPPAPRTSGRSSGRGRSPGWARPARSPRGRARPRGRWPPCVGTSGRGGGRRLVSRRLLADRSRVRRSRPRRRGARRRPRHGPPVVRRRAVLDVDGGRSGGRHRPVHRRGHGHWGVPGPDGPPESGGWMPDGALRLDPRGVPRVRLRPGDRGLAHLLRGGRQVAGQRAVPPDHLARLVLVADEPPGRTQARRAARRPRHGPPRGPRQRVRPAPGADGRPARCRGALVRPRWDRRVRAACGGPRRRRGRVDGGAGRDRAPPARGGGRRTSAGRSWHRSVRSCSSSPRDRTDP